MEGREENAALMVSEKERYVAVAERGRMFHVEHFLLNEGRAQSGDGDLDRKYSGDTSSPLPDLPLASNCPPLRRNVPRGTFSDCGPRVRHEDSHYIWEPPLGPKASRLGSFRSGLRNGLSKATAAASSCGLILDFGWSQPDRKKCSTWNIFRGSGASTRRSPNVTSPPGTRLCLAGSGRQSLLGPSRPA